MQVFSRIFNFVGYCLYALALIHFTYKGIMKISSGSVLMGVVFILMALAGAAYWYWQLRPVRWGQQMLTAVVERESEKRSDSRTCLSGNPMANSTWLGCGSELVQADRV